MRLSASQITTWLDCRRKWSFIYQDGMRPEPTKASLLGSEVHAQLEMYLHGGSLDYTKESGYIADEALLWLPVPIPPLEIEHEFFLVSPKHQYSGFIDLRKGTKVYDHKTTSDLKWAKSEEDLQWDVQANIYAVTTLVDFPEASAIPLQWTYLTTKKPYKALAVETSITREHVEEFFPVVEQIGDQIQSAVGTPTLELPPSPESCERFGGCPFRYVCNLSPQERLTSIMSQGTENLIQSLRARRAINPPPSVVPPIVKVPNNDLPDLELPRKEEPAPVEAKTDTIPAPAPAKEKPAKQAIDTLYLDCFPMKPKRGNVEYFDSFVAKAKTTVETEHKVSDYRFLPFGQGPGALAKAFEMVIKESQIDGLVVLDSSTPEALVCMSVLMANSARQIKGV